MSEHVFTSAPTVAGQTGSLLAVLDRIACLGECQTHLTGGTVWTDQTAEARLEGGTSFTALSVVSDEIYVGMDVKFTALRLKLTTLGVLGSAVIVWEYWNGTAWTTLAVTGSPTGAKDFTATGAVTWTAPGDWAANVVNAGPSLFHVRARVTVANYTTAPTLEYAVHNWTIYDGAAGTNAKVYKSLGEDGTSTILLWVSDNGTEFTNAQNAGARLYESWDNVGHTGTAPTPTAAQLANGVNVRKSFSLDATARTVYAGVSRDRIVLLILTGDTASQGVGFYAGKFLSKVAGDGFGQVIIGQADATTLTRFGDVIPINSVTLAGHYLQRAYTGTGGSTAAGKLHPLGGGVANTWLPLTNGPDGAVHTSPLLLTEAGPAIRGELLGVRGLNVANTAAINNAVDTLTDTPAGPSGGTRHVLFRHRDAGGTAYAFVGLRGAA